MKPRERHVLLLWMLVCSGATEAVDPFTIGAGVAGTAAAGIFSPMIYCRFKECCRPNWVSFKSTGLKKDLDNKLFGQHVASRIILKAVDGFMSNDNPKKPLVLSLHGSTGTGKNFASQLIAENIYEKGIKSNFFHVLSATHHFPHPKQHLQTYKHQLKQLLRDSVTDCERSMFIFDEVDKMDPQLIDSIKSYLDYYDNLDGVSYRKAIFIFLSNAGGDSIAQTALDFWKAGQKREEIGHNDLGTSLSLSLFNNKDSGFFHSSLIDKSLVDFFVPLLPLEYKHVVQCAMAEMKARGRQPDQDVAERLAKDLVYFPKSERVFSSTGCKTVDTKLNFYL
ncbi:torsin-1A-like [Seriola lalandi dorsalis]|uniref:Torsin n=2 Tax=Seriola TaxID=8160 RepID=A0A3B4Y7Z4_SERLL|nr:torsin-1A-like [Seriola lalandi dorsalis]